MGLDEREGGVVSCTLLYTLLVAVCLCFWIWSFCSVYDTTASGTTPSCYLAFAAQGEGIDMALYMAGGVFAELEGGEGRAPFDIYGYLMQGYRGVWDI